jgi:uncharacterized protein YwqG
MDAIELEKAILGSVLKDKWNALKPLVRNSIHAALASVEDGSLPVGASKLGGKPDLPADQEWPREGNGTPLSFIGQIDFGAAGKYDTDNLLPKSGLAVFFYSSSQETWGFDPQDKDKFKVLFFPSKEKLARRALPAELPENGIFKACALSFSSAVSLPSSENKRIRSLLKNEEADFYGDMIEPGVRSKLLGYSDIIQSEMELDCALVTNGIYIGDTKGYKDPRRKELEKETDQWRMLLQVDSEEDAGMMWGDSGRIYFWIKLSDLKDMAFDRTWQILQCS